MVKIIVRSLISIYQGEVKYIKRHPIGSEKFVNKL